MKSGASRHGTMARRPKMPSHFRLNAALTSADGRSASFSTQIWTNRCRSVILYLSPSVWPNFRKTVDVQSAFNLLFVAAPAPIVTG